MYACTFRVFELNTFLRCLIFFIHLYLRVSTKGQLESMVDDLMVRMASIYGKNEGTGVGKSMREISGFYK